MYGGENVKRNSLKENVFLSKNERKTHSVFMHTYMDKNINVIVFFSEL